MPPEDSNKKIEPAPESEVLLGAFGSPSTPIAKGGVSTDALRTMQKDIAEAKKQQDISFKAPSGQSMDTDLLTTAWSKVSGEKSADKEVAELAKERAVVEQIRAKARAEAKVEEEKARKQDAERLAATLQKKSTLVESKIATPTENTEVRDRAIEAASTKAAVIMATHEKELSGTAVEAAGIIEEKEKIRTTIAGIIEKEKEALAEIIKLVEKEERSRAEIIKSEALQKRARTEMTANLAEASLTKEQQEAEIAEILAKKERAEAIEAEVVAKKERERAHEALKIEAQEIFTADKQVEIALDAVAKEVSLLQDQARSEAEFITLTQKTAREAEAAEISAIEKGTRQ